MSQGRRPALVISSVLLALLAAGPASAYPRPGRVELVSVASDGTQGDASSFPPSISRDGRFVAFSSAAATLVPGDTNKVDDVFVFDRVTRETERVSVTSDGSQAKAGPGGSGSFHPSIGADGRYVAFFSLSPNLVPGDTNNLHDVFLHDRLTGITERVSVSSEETQGNSASSLSPFQSPPVISDDGRYVVFASSASNLVPGDSNGVQDVFIRDRQEGTTERVSLGAGGAQGDATSQAPSLSADGRFVAFHSDATNLVSGDANASRDVFVHDRETGATGLVSVASDGTAGDEGFFGAQYPVISADGSTVVYYSWSGLLVPSDTNETADVFAHDLETGVTERVSVSSAGAQGNASSGYASVSSDGRFVAFYSGAANLVPGDANAKQDVFVHDRVTGVTERASVSEEGIEGNNGSWGSTISGDGRFVAFQSFASNLVPGDANTFGQSDVILRDRGPATGVGDLEVRPGPDGLDVSGWATFAGQVVSSATDPPADGGQVGPLTARDVGGELTGAEVVYRPETEDMLLRVRLAALPGPGQLVGAGVTYAAAFVAAGVAYEARAVRGTASGPSAEAAFTLHRCQTECEELGALQGGLGTAGTDLRMAVPLEAIGLEAGEGLQEVRVSTHLGRDPLRLAPLDAIDLPAATLPVATVRIGLAPESAPLESVAFDTAADLAAGTFTASAGPAGSDQRVWALACLGPVCGSVSRPAPW